jgi:hypothetical protein
MFTFELIYITSFKRIYLWITIHKWFNVDYLRDGVTLLLLWRIAVDLCSRLNIYISLHLRGYIYGLLSINGLTSTICVTELRCYCFEV